MGVAWELYRDPGGNGMVCALIMLVKREVLCANYHH